MTDNELGQRLASLRQGKGLSIRSLAGQVGISSGYLSALERGQNSITVGKLKAIVGALGMSLSDFFAQGETPAVKIAYRRDELVELSGDKSISMLEIASGRPGRALQMTWEHYKPGADTGPEGYSYEGEDTGVVLKGQLEFTVGDDLFTLGPGDGYYRDGRLPTRVRNVGRGEAVMVCCNTPVRF